MLPRTNPLSSKHCQIQLVKHTEDKLLTLMTPAEQLKILRLKKEITPMERIEAESGLSAWESSIFNADKSLTKKQGQTRDDIKSMNLHSLPATTSVKKLPPVRGASTPVSTSSKEVNNTQTENSAECEGVVNRMRLAGKLIIYDAGIATICLRLLCECDCS